MKTPIKHRKERTCPNNLKIAHFTHHKTKKKQKTELSTYATKTYQLIREINVSANSQKLIPREMSKNADLQKLNLQIKLIKSF